MEVINSVALSLGAAWASGINLYAAVFMLGFMHSGGYLALPPDLLILADPLVLAAAGFMYCVEFFADKTPGVDSLWDGIHTFIRIPAGALLAAGAVGEMGPAAEIAGLLIGGGLAAGAHTLKAGGRVLINTSPEPFTNWGASIGEDVLVIGGLWTALHYPWLFLAMLVLFIVLLVWLLPKLLRAIGTLFTRLRGWIRGEHPPPPGQAPPPSTNEPPLPPPGQQ
ncbi:MAG: DUF4126 domain-containing protein [Gammaproteobacteria bacterium]|nr:MAG: DUF4126 domain-containing protein [Gammaproteobacteria bacterium]